MSNSVGDQYFLRRPEARFRVSFNSNGISAFLIKDFSAAAIIDGAESVESSG